MGGAHLEALSADHGSDNSADDCGAEGDHARVVVPAMMMVVHRGRRRWRRQMVVPVRCGMVHRRGAAVPVASAAWRRKAGSRERQAGKDRSEGFQGLVHITPSLSVWFCCAHLALTYCKVCINRFSDKVFFG